MPMKVLNKKQLRIWFCAQLMQRKDRLRFFTLTVPENNLPLRIVADRWRSFANTRWWRKLTRGQSYLMVYEPHPGGHGWHIHCLTNFFIPWQELALMARAVHFGHTDIEAVDNGCALYCAKYITKAEVFRQVQDSRSVRIVNVSRNLLAVRDIDVSSPSVDFIRSHWLDLDRFKMLPHRQMKELYYCWIYSWSGVVLSPIVEHWAEVIFQRRHCTCVFR